MASFLGLPAKDPLHQILDVYQEFKKKGKDAYLSLDQNKNLICKIYEKKIFTSRPKTNETEFSFKNEQGERIEINVVIDNVVPAEKIKELTTSLFSYSPQKNESGYKSASARSTGESPVFVRTGSRESSLSEEFEIVEHPLDPPQAYNNLVKTYETLYNICENPSEISPDVIKKLENEIISYKSLKGVLPILFEDETFKEFEGSWNDFEGLCNDIDTLIRKIKTKLDIQNLATSFSASIMKSSLEEVATLKRAEKEQAAETLMNKGIDIATETIIENLLNSYIHQVEDERNKASQIQFKQIKEASRSIKIPSLDEFLSAARKLGRGYQEGEIFNDTTDSVFIKKLTDLQKMFSALNSDIEGNSEPIESLLSSVRENRFFSAEEKADLLGVLENKNNQLKQKKKELDEALLPLAQLNKNCQERQLIRTEILKDAINALIDFQGTPLFSMRDGKLMVEKKGLFASHPSIKIGKKALHFKEGNKDEILKLLEFTSVYESQKHGSDGTPIASISPDLKPLNFKLQQLKEGFKLQLLQKL